MSSAASRPPYSASQLPYQTMDQAAAGSTSAGSAQPSVPSSLQVSSMQVSSMQASSMQPSSVKSSAASTSASEPRPPKRPQLMGPPARPVAPKPAPERTQTVVKKPPEPETPKVIGPISKPSERMQYRAIGLLKGRYVASEEQFNRGDILLTDDTLIDSVLLGRVTSLIKKHIDLETEHIWVVYPRTLYKEEEKEPALHMQIVGVWEPETLSSKEGNSGESSHQADSQAGNQTSGKESDRQNDSNLLDPTSDRASKTPRYLSTEEATEQCDRFSIRGEVAKYSEETNEITVNIVQKSKSDNAKPKRPFKLLIKGQLEGRTVGYFWDLEVKREGGELKLEEATPVGVVPPKKKPKNARKSGGKKPHHKSRHSAPKPAPKKKKADSTTHPVEINRVETNQAKPDLATESSDSPAAESIQSSVTPASPSTSTQLGTQPTDASATKATESTEAQADASKSTDVETN